MYIGGEARIQSVILIQYMYEKSTKATVEIRMVVKHIVGKGYHEGR